MEECEAKVRVWDGLSEVLLKKVQQRDLVMFCRLWTSDAVSLVGINLQERERKQICRFIVSV